MALVEIKNLKVAVEDKTILNGVDLKIEPGEVHVLMGQNGVGKSTLVSAVMGDPSYEVLDGQILFDGKQIDEIPHAVFKSSLTMVNQEIALFLD